MAQAHVPKKESTETVLLRNPLPKYNFQARKLPKDSQTTQPPSQPTSQPTSQQSSQPPSQPTSQVTSTLHQPCLSFTSSVSNSSTLQSTSQTCVESSSTGLTKQSASVKPFTSMTKSESFPGFERASVKPVAAVVASNIRGRGGGGAQEECKEAERRREVGGALGGDGLRAASSDMEENIKGAVRLSYLPNLSTVSQASAIPVPDSALLAHAVEGPSMAERLERAEKEVTMLKSQLEVQLQVNAEIKRLLVASVGEDFERKVENLARDRAELAMELGDFTKKMTEDYENLDQISIQADMWRSKYLASRVMVEELASARAFYSNQFHNSQQAVQEMLNERYELRTNLVQSYKCLQQVKEAFDPFNSQKSHSLSSTNVLDLAKNIKQLSEAVRFRLIPAHAGSHVMMPLEESWENTMTRAELLAYDQLTKQTEPPSFKHSIPSVPVLTTSKSFERFHPLARHDNVTINCCTHCKGDIKVA